MKKIFLLFTDVWTLQFVQNSPPSVPHKRITSYCIRSPADWIPSRYIKALQYPPFGFGAGNLTYISTSSSRQTLAENLFQCHRFLTYPVRNITRIFLSREVTISSIRSLARNRSAVDCEMTTINFVFRISWIFVSAAGRLHNNRKIPILFWDHFTARYKCFDAWNLTYTLVLNHNKQNRTVVSNNSRVLFSFRSRSYKRRTLPDNFHLSV